MDMDPYKRGLIKRVPFAKKRRIFSKLVAIMDMEVKKRGLQLIPSYTRVLLKDEIHELIITDEKDANPDEKVDSISYLFVEIEKGGVAAVGDKVSLEGKIIGEVAGFDETHMPNHWNIVIKSSKKATGMELNALVGGKIIFG